MRPFLLACAVLTLNACAHAQPAPAMPELTVAPTDSLSLRRTACFGECPVYSLTVHGDGRVDYLGERHVRVVGEEHWTIAPVAVNELFGAFVRAQYLQLVTPKESGVHVSDLPSADTELRLGGKQHAIHHYGPNENVLLGQGPATEELSRLERLVDTLTGSERVVLCGGRSAKICGSVER